MDMFEKATKAVKEVGENVIDSAKNIGNSIYSVSKEQSELASMKLQKSSIEKKLDDAYSKIGKKYVEYIKELEGEAPLDISEILDEMRPDLDKIDEINNALAEKELAAKKEEEEKILKKASDEYNDQKEKLDKALALEIISDEEYAEKLAKVQKKYDNFEQLRKYDMQLQMEIITEEEYKEKVDTLLNS